jgi:phosphoribosyl-dephospho-CoA transferase
MTLALHVHDLMQPLAADCVRAENPAEQQAVDAALLQANLVVVRRPVISEGVVSVGVRGRSREQRYAARMNVCDVRAVYSPQQLRLDVEAVKELTCSAPACRALAALQQRWSALPLRWGPVGSVGFALASGVEVVHAASDLDVAVFVNAPLTEALIEELQQGVRGHACAVDVLLETPLGGVALAELRELRVMVRGREGVCLLDRERLIEGEAQLSVPVQ